MGGELFWVKWRPAASVRVAQWPLVNSGLMVGLRLAIWGQHGQPSHSPGRRLGQVARLGRTGRATLCPMWPNGQKGLSPFFLKGRMMKNRTGWDALGQPMAEFDLEHGNLCGLRGHGSQTRLNLDLWTKPGMCLTKSQPKI